MRLAQRRAPFSHGGNGCLDWPSGVCRTRRGGTLGKGTSAAGHAGAPLPFVSTNPRGDARVNANDRVLVLAPQDWEGFSEEEEGGE